MFWWWRGHLCTQWQRTFNHQLPIDSAHGTEALFIQCDLPFSKVVVGQVYRPPGVCATLFTDQMTHILETVCKLKSRKFICGDFNFDLSEIFQNETVDRFLNLFTSFGFFPLVTRTTRYCASKLSLLDNIFFFCNYIGNVQGLRHADENGGGDGDQAAAKPGFSSEGNPYQKPKTQRIWPTIFLKMGGGDYPPYSQKWGDASPPSPLWRSPW